MSRSPSSASRARNRNEPEAVVKRHDRIVHAEAAAAETVLGAVVGGVVGSLAGPLGVASGAALGGGVAAVLACASNRAEHEEAEHGRDLDAGRVEEIEDAPLPGISTEDLARELES